MLCALLCRTSLDVDMTGLYHQHLHEEELADRLDQAQTFSEIFDVLTTSVFPDEAMRRVSETSEHAGDGKPDPVSN